MPVIGLAVGALIGGGAAAAGIIGGSILTGALIGGAIGLGAGLLADSLVPKITSPKRILEFKADPEAGIPYLMGRCATGGNLVAQLVSAEPQHNWLHNFVVLSGCGPIEEIQSGFKLGEDSITFSGSSATGTFANHLWMTTNLGALTSWSLNQPSNTGVVPDWGSSHKLTGYAAARLVMKYSQDKFPGGSFGTPRWIVKGVKVYDPRLDSSQTEIGGSGPQDIADESTWAWSDNPYLHALTWCIGRRQNGILVAGIGVPTGLIDIPAFVEGANICEAGANDWALGGGVTTRDDPYEVLKSMLQAGGGQALTVGGKISCLVNMPKTPVAAITEEDLDGEARAAKRARRRDRFNRVIPKYVSESHDWETVAADAYTVTAYSDADGVRTRELTFPLVQDATQATQLAAYGIYDAHERQPVRLPVRLGFARVNAGDVITAYLPSLGIEQDLLVTSKTQDPVSLAVELECRGENTNKHTVALALTGTAPAVPTPTLPDPKVVPTPATGQWALNSTTETNGSQVYPVISFVGSASDNGAVESVAFRYQNTTDSGPLVDLGEYSPQAAETGQVRIPTPLSGKEYLGFVAYRVRGVLSAYIGLTGVTASTFDPGTTGGGGGGVPGVGETIVETSSPGADSWLANFTGTVTGTIDGGGGSYGDPYITEGEKGGEGETTQTGGGGGGARSIKTISVTSGVTTLSYVVGAGGEGTAGGNTTLTDGGAVSMSAGGGGAGTADSLGYAAGTGGTASGGDTNTSGTGGSDYAGGAGASGAAGGDAGWYDGVGPGGGGASNSDLTGYGTNGYGIGGPGKIKLVRAS